MGFTKFYFKLELGKIPLRSFSFVQLKIEQNFVNFQNKHPKIKNILTRVEVIFCPAIVFTSKKQ